MMLIEKFGGSVCGPELFGDAGEEGVVGGSLSLYIRTSTSSSCLFSVGNSERDGNLA